jgi:hypothetical protein
MARRSGTRHGGKIAGCPEWGLSALNRYGWRSRVGAVVDTRFGDPVVAA